jgi:hypothetical protein
MGSLFYPVIAQMPPKGAALTITSEWAGVLATILIAILTAVLGQLKASWDMRSDLRVGITKIESLEKGFHDHEERLRDLEKKH